MAPETQDPMPRARAPVVAAPRRGHHVLPIVVGAIAITATRYAILARHREPVGVDVGNWITVGYTLTGQGFSGTGAVAAPLVPLAARLFDLGLGLGRTSWVLGATCATAAGLGTWWALRREVRWWWAGWAGLLVAVAGATSAAAAWGGYPQLLGLATLPPAVAAAAHLAGCALPQRRQALVLGGWLAAVAVSSHLALAWTALAVAIALVAMGVRSHRWGWLRPLPWAAVPSLPLVPLYVALLRQFDPLPDRRASIRFSEATDIVLVGGRWWWLALGATAATGLIAMRRTTRPVGWTLAASLLLTGVLATIFGPDQRFAYVLPSALAVSAAWVLDEVAASGPRRAWAAGAVAVLTAAALVLPAAGTQETQRDFYAHFAPAGSMDAIDVLARVSEPGDLVAAAPVDGVPAGWLAEGGARRQTLVASSEEWLFVAEQREQARVANDLFTDPRWPSERSFERARSAGVRWLYVPSTWGGVDEEALAAASARHPGLVVADERGNLVIRVPPV